MNHNNNNKIFTWLLICFISIAISACDSNTYYPKPRGYFRIDFPVKEFKEFSPQNCPFSFKIPVYASMVKDSIGLTEPCWYDIVFKKYNAKVHLSYKSLKNNFFDHANDTRKLVYKHSDKADAIDQYLVHPSPDVSGVIYQIGGNAASSVQFYVSDSTKHFLRGSLYFNCTPNEDSLAPVIKFIEKDIEVMISTLEWK